MRFNGLMVPMTRKVDTALASDTPPADEPMPDGTDATAARLDQPDPERRRPPGQPTQPGRPKDWLVRPGRDDRPRPPRSDQPRSHSGDPGELKERMDALPDGNPSSPRDPNGTPRPPAPSLADYELPNGPWTDADWTDHVSEIDRATQEAREAGLDTKERFGDPDVQGIWSRERAAQHAEILAEVYAAIAQVPCERQAIVAGGLPGAGKTTVLRDQAGIDLTKYVMINPDDFKQIMAQRGMIPEVKGLSPMEASSLVHEESSYLAHELADRVVSEGRNVIWDITMSSFESVTARLEPLRRSGYEQVSAIFIDIPPNVSVARADKRHRHGEDLYRLGEGCGGRHIPPSLIWSRYDREYSTANRRVFELVKDTVSTWVVYDNSIDDRPAVVVSRDGTDVSTATTDSGEMNTSERELR